MLPEVEVIGIMKDNKRHSTMTIIYGEAGWVAHLVNFSVSAGSKVIAKGKEKLSSETAKALVSDLANKWREDEQKAGRF